MKTKENLLKTVEGFRITEKTISNMVREYVQDRDIPLEDRWEVFRKSGMGYEASFVIHPDGAKDVFDAWGCPSFYIERYETVLIGDNIDELEGHPEALEEYKIDIPVLKEWVLDKFMRSYKMDW